MSEDIIEGIGPCRICGKETMPGSAELLPNGTKKEYYHCTGKDEYGLPHFFLVINNNGREKYPLTSEVGLDE